MMSAKPKAVIILNRLPLTENPYQDWAGKSGTKLFLICDEKILKNTPHSPDGFEKVFSIANYEQNAQIEKIVLDLSQSFDIVGISSASEVDVVRTARLRDALGLTVNSEQVFLRLRDKVLMKEAAQAAGLRAPRFSNVESGVDLYDASRKIGLPLVLKPTLYGGAVGVKICRAPSDMDPLYSELFLKPDITSPHIAEEFIDLPMYHLDGIFSNGAIDIVLTSEYIKGCLAYKDGETHGSMIVDPERTVHKNCVEDLKKFFNYLKPPTAFAFHAEFFYDNEKEQPVFCEVAARPGGGRIREMIAESMNGLDLFKKHIQLQTTGDTFEFDHCKLPKPCGWLMVPPREGMLKKTNDATPRCVLGLRSKFIDGDSTRKAAHSADELASCLFKAQSFSELFIIADSVSQWLTANYTIEPAQKEKAQ
jgi:hypothetical protein